MNDNAHPKLIYILSEQDGKHQATWIGQAGLKDQSQINLPPNSGELMYLAGTKARSDLKGMPTPVSVMHAETAVTFSRRKVDFFTVTNVKKVIEMSGILPVRNPSELPGNNWYDCSPETAINALRAAKEGRKNISAREIIPWPEKRGKAPRPSRGHKRRQGTHAPADAMDWDDAQMVIRALMDDARYRDAMLVAVGCYMGLRISDSLGLRWSDIVDKDRIEITEQKTGKKRAVKVNPSLAAIARECYDELYIENPGEYIARSSQNGGTTHITRQRVNQIIHGIKDRYMPDKKLVFSSHTFRKTFGRRVYENECRKGRGDTALMLLADVFGHSNTNITKRYLGIRKEEILSVYDIL